MNIRIKKTLIGLIALCLLVISYSSVQPVKTVEAACNEIPYGFVTASISITDLTTGNTASGLSTSSEFPGSASLDYTVGGDVYIEINGGGNQQQDDPVYVEASGFDSNEGNYLGGLSYGYSVPAFSQTFTGFNAGFVTVRAEQCPNDVASFTIYMNGLSPTPTFTCDVNIPSQTIDPDSSTSYNVTTTPSNGFNSPVTFTAAVDPQTTNPPSVSFTNNGQVPSATTVAVITTTSATTPGTYTLNFVGSGGGETASCNTELIVNPAAADFQLTLSPSTSVVTDPNRSNIGSSPVFTVFASCTGGFSGPVTNLTASTTFGGVSLALGSTSLACGSTTTLTVSNTGSVPANQQSSMINTILETLVVTGQGQL